MLRLLREDISSSFSELWYRVNTTTPRLASHARVTPQRFGERSVYVVEDPAGGNFYRLSESAYFFLGMLDGKVAVQAAWEACCTQLGDAAPTQRECIDLLSKLQYFGLLSGDLPLSTTMVERRQREGRKRRRQRRLGGGLGLSLSVPLVNPERFLQSISYALRAIFSPAAFLVYLIFIVWAGFSLFTNRDSFMAQLSTTLDARNLVWISILFVLLRGLHEFGHAAACKAMGGRCTEIGMMLIGFIFPFPYCDTSSAWRFPEVYKRVVVSAGGMLFETFVAAIAAIAWAATAEDQTLARALLFNTVLISGITTVLFNANPLLRYDGYYILSDITGIANLAQRAKELIRFLWLRYVMRVAAIKAPAVSGLGEFWLLICYHLLSTPYRLLITASIVMALWTSEQFITLGSVIAVFAGCAWIVWPALKYIGFLVGSPLLLGRRARALSVTLTLLLFVGLPIVLLPVPAPTYATGTIEPRRSSPIRPSEPGFIEQVLVAQGQMVKEGDVLFVLRNPELVTQYEQSKAMESRATALSNSATDQSGTSQASIAQLQVELAEQARVRLGARVENLTVRASQAGRFTPTTMGTAEQGQGTVLLLPANLEGRFIEKGTLLGLVASIDDLVVRAVVDDSQHAYIFADRAANSVPVSFRVRGNAGVVTNAKVSRSAATATRELSQASLARGAGGEIEIDGTNPAKPVSSNPLFSVELTPDKRQEGWQAGLRARVRFENDPAPLAAQWWRTLQQFLSQTTRT